MNYSEKHVKKRAARLRSKWVRRGKMVQVLLLRLCFVLLIGGIGYGGYLSYQYARELFAEVPDARSIELIPKGAPTKILDDEGEVIRTLTNEDTDRDYVMLDRIPTDLQNAFIAIEDADFRSHEGIEPVDVLRSFRRGLSNGGHFSRSNLTITGQLLKNQGLTGSEGDDFSSRFRHMLQEQYLALSLETRYSKDEILEYYLNTIYLGQNTIGVGAASRRYFNKPVSELTLPECATLAAIAKNPTSYNPITHSSRNRNRELAVLTAMQDQGFITSDQYEEAIVDPVQSRIQRYAGETESSGDHSDKKTQDSYFTDALIQSVIQDMKSELN